MTQYNETPIGAVRTDATEKPEATAAEQLCGFLEGSEFASCGVAQRLRLPSSGLRLPRSLSAQRQDVVSTVDSFDLEKYLLAAAWLKQIQLVHRSLTAIA